MSFGFPATGSGWAAAAFGGLKPSDIAPIPLAFQARVPEKTANRRGSAPINGYALRFVAYGARQYLTLGLESEGWDRRRAEEELANILADVRRGIWVPPQRRRQPGEKAGEAPLFGPFASELVASREGQVAENTLRSDEWALSHLLPYFAEWPLPAIDAEAVDA